VPDLHCRATILLAPYDEGAGRNDEGTQALADRAAADNVARVYGGTDVAVVQRMRSVEDALEAGSEQRHGLDADEVTDELEAIADLHRGETVLVLLPAATVTSALDALVGRRVRRRSGASMHYGSVVEVATDADGWALRTRVTPTDSVPETVADAEKT
jgi:hypothetical protein